MMFQEIETDLYFTLCLADVCLTNQTGLTARATRTAPDPAQTAAPDRETP